jgi:hypothetical protein
MENRDKVQTNSSVSSKRHLQSQSIDIQSNDFSIKPETSNWQEFIEHPNLFRPAPEFLNPGFFIEVFATALSTRCVLNIA